MLSLSAFLHNYVHSHAIACVCFLQVAMPLKKLQETQKEKAETNAHYHSTKSLWREFVLQTLCHNSYRESFITKDYTYSFLLPRLFLLPPSPSLPLLCWTNQMHAYRSNWTKTTSSLTKKVRITGKTVSLLHTAVCREQNSHIHIYTPQKANEPLHKSCYQNTCLKNRPKKMNCHNHIPHPWVYSEGPRTDWNPKSLIAIRDLKDQ